MNGSTFLLLCSSERKKRTISHLLYLWISLMYKLFILIMLVCGITGRSSSFIAFPVFLNPLFHVLALQDADEIHSWWHIMCWLTNIYNKVHIGCDLRFSVWKSWRDQNLFLPWKTSFGVVSNKKEVIYRSSFKMLPGLAYVNLQDSVLLDCLSVSCIFFFLFWCFLRSFLVIKKGAP